MNLKKIQDSILLEGKFKLSNDNDWVNFINRIDPNWTIEDTEELRTKLYEKSSNEDPTIYFVLGDEPLRNSILEWPVRDMKVSFKEVL